MTRPKTPANTSSAASAPRQQDPSPSLTDVPSNYRLHLTDQIASSLKRGTDSDSSSAEDSDSRIKGSLAAWTGMTQDGDAVEAMLAAQIIVTHDLAMAAIGEAVGRTGDVKCYFSDRVNDACKVARASLRQIETLARYRTWRQRSDAEARQMEHAQHEQKILNAEAG